MNTVIICATVVAFVAFCLGVFMILIRPVQQKHFRLNPTLLAWDRVKRAQRLRDYQEERV